MLIEFANGKYEGYRAGILGVGSTAMLDASICAWL